MTSNHLRRDRGRLAASSRALPPYNSASPLRIHERSRTMTFSRGTQSSAFMGRSLIRRSATVGLLCADHGASRPNFSDRLTGDTPGGTRFGLRPWSAPYCERTRCDKEEHRLVLPRRGYELDRRVY